MSTIIKSYIGQCKMFLYIIINKINNKVYIGYTTHKNIQKYWDKHFSNAKSISNNRYFYRAIRKYGKEAFECKILATFETIEEVRQAEIDVIAKYKSNINRYGNEFGYNMTDGGEGHRGPRSEETKKKISKSHMGIRPSDETKKKLSEINKGKPCHMKGKFHSEETKKKMSLAKIGKPTSKRGKSKYSSLICNQIKEEYLLGNTSHRKLAKKYNIPSSTIKYICNKKQ